MPFEPPKNHVLEYLTDLPLTWLTIGVLCEDEDESVSSSSVTEIVSSAHLFSTSSSPNFGNFISSDIHLEEVLRTIVNNVVGGESSAPKAQIFTSRRRTCTKYYKQSWA